MDTNALSKISHGIYIVGVKDENNRLCGCIVDALMQVTATPFGIALCTNKKSYTTACIKNAREFTVSILGEDADPKLIARFGLNSSRDIDKWQDVDYKLIDDLPVLTDCLGSFKVKVFHELELSTHILWNCEVLDAVDGKDKTPMTYDFYRNNVSSLARKAQKGEEIEPVKTQEANNTQEEKFELKWVCGVCGHVYDGEIPFEDLPGDWVCPDCFCGKEVFSQMKVKASKGN